MLVEAPEEKTGRDNIPKRPALPATTKEKIAVIKDRLSRLYNGSLTMEESSRKKVDETLLEYLLADKHD